jgi:NAD(P)-dependent dehydrogenase (short-subunit alcohol dehydrogenase family)
MAGLDFTARTVIVTGGTRGIGRGIAEVFRDAGATVFVCGRRPPADPIGTFVAADVRTLEGIEGVVEAAMAATGRLDVLVNNAGGSPPAEAATASPRFSEAILRLNLIAPLNFAQRVNRVMQAQETGGVIVNIGSVSALRPSPGTAAYGAAKAGLSSLTRSLAVEWAPKVRVVGVVGGPIRTEAADDHYGGPAGIAAIDRTIPMGRMGTPMDIASAVLYVASDAAPWITGTDLVVHGGGERPAFLGAVEEAADGS